MPDREPSIKYLVRIMEVLMKHEAIAITNLAMLSRINFNRCVILLNLLEKTGFIRTMTMGNKIKYISLTDIGKEYAKKLLEVDKINALIYS